MSHTYIGLFDSYQDAQTAVHDLEAAGVPHADVAVVSSNATGEHAVGDKSSGKKADEAGDDAGKGATVGTVIGGAGGLLAGLGLLAIPGLGPVVAAGWLASTAVGALAGAVVGGAAGGLVGALTHAGVNEQDAHVYAEGVRRGGTVVSAKTDDAHMEVARSVLHGSRAVDIINRRSAYQSEGWSRFDDTAAAYTPDQVAAERARYARI